jgi:hypothetical protein
MLRFRDERMIEEEEEEEKGHLDDTGTGGNRDSAEGDFLTWWVWTLDPKVSL